MVEASAGLLHRDGANDLTEKHEEKTEDEDEVLCLVGEQGYRGGELQVVDGKWRSLGEKSVCDDEFGDGGAVCDVVCGTVAAEEKGGY